MANVKKLNWIHWAIQEGLNGNTLELERALGIVEDIREEYERRTIFATFIHDPQEAHAMCMQEAIDEYKIFENIEDARKDLLEELLNLYARNNQLTHENDRELKVWLAANEIWPTDKDDEALDEWPIGRQEMNGEGTIACLYEIHLN